MDHGATLHLHVNVSDLLHVNVSDLLHVASLEEIKLVYNILLSLPVQDCDVLDAIDHGYVTYSSGTKFGSTATYVCNTGYTFVNSSSPRECESNGMWNGTEPECARR